MHCKGGEETDFWIADQPQGTHGSLPQIILDLLYMAIPFDLERQIGGKR